MPCAHLRAAAVLQLVHHWLMSELVQNLKVCSVQFRQLCTFYSAQSDSCIGAELEGG